jgi:uncharacterized glyoxalase superfamily protein PhnB
MSVATSPQATNGRSAKAVNMPWLSPCLTVLDAAKTLEFYQKAFGFQKRDVYPGPDGKIMHADLTWHDAVIMIGPECEQNQSKAPVTTGVRSAVGLYLYCDDVDAQYARATAAGAKAHMPPTDMFWGDRICCVIDLDGHIWSFATHTGCTAPNPCGASPA